MTATVLYEAPRAQPRPGETIVTSTCGHNCGGRCVVNAHVRDDRIVRISTDARRWRPDHPPLPACARGIGQIERSPVIPDRLQHPMRRVGPRGSGEFERISWDEALGTVARELCRVRDTYGNAAILDASRTGSLSMLHGGRAAAQRFLDMFKWLHGSLVQHVGRGRGVLGAHHLRRQGQLQDSRPRTYRLRQFEADPDVGLEPRRRHVWHRHDAVTEGSEAAGHAHHLCRPSPHDDQPATGRRAHLHPLPPPTRPR